MLTLKAVGWHCNGYPKTSGIRRPNCKLHAVELSASSHPFSCSHAGQQHCGPRADRDGDSGPVSAAPNV